MKQIHLSNIMWTIALFMICVISHIHQNSLKPKETSLLVNHESSIVSIQKRAKKSWVLLTLENMPGIFGLSSYNVDESFQIGDLIIINGSIEPTKKLSSLAGYIQLEKPPTLKNRPPPSLSRTLKMFYLKLCDRHLHAISRQFTPALFLGDRGEFYGPLYTRFQLTGTLHYLALSGLHVGLILIPWIFLFRIFYLSTRWQFFLCLPLLLLYLYLTGPIPSLVRAVLSFFFLTIAVLLKRHAHQYNVLCFVAILCLIIQPQQIHSPGFLMTFSALIGIIFIGQKLFQLIPTYQNIWVYKALCFSTGAWLGIAPVLLWVFGEIYPAALLLNLLLLPPVTLLLFLAMIFPLWPTAFGPLIEWLWKLIEQCLILALRYLHKPIVPDQHKLAAIIFGLFIILWLLNIMKSRKLTLGVLCACFLIYICAPVDHPFTKPRLRQFNVGQGSSYLIESSKDHTFLVDCGGSRIQVGRRVIIDRFKKNGVNELTGIFLTHLDSDHRNALQDILARYSVGFIGLNSKQVDPYALNIIKDLSHLFHVPLIELTYGDQLTYGQTTFVIEHPTEKSPGPENERSLVIRLIGQEKTILFTGDLDEKGTKDFLLRKNLGAVDIMTAPHHGSYNKFNLLLIETLQPKEIWLSARQRFPKDPTILNFKNLKKSCEEEVEVEF